MDGFSILEATCSTTRNEAFRLRYRCLTTENNDQRYADHQTGVYVDPWDRGPARIFIATHCGAAIGTVRYIRRRDSTFPADDIYDYEGISAAANVSTSQVKREAALLDRGCVRAEFRRKGVFQMMQDYLECLSQSQGITTHIGLVDKENLAMDSTLLNSGWEKIGSKVSCRSWHGYCYIKRLEFTQRQ